MELENIITRMVELGFKDYGWDPFFKGQCRIFGRRMVDGPSCDCNERIPELLVHVYVYPEKNSNMRVEFDVCGQAGTVWMKPMIYAVKIDEIEEVLPRLTRAMEAMWKAGYEAMKAIG